MSQDIDQTVWRGFEALRLIAEQTTLRDLAAPAKEAHRGLARSARGGPMVAFIATRGENVADKDIVDAMDRFIEQAERLPSGYEQPAFQCLSDFKKATEAGTSRFLAGFALAVCMAERVLNIRVSAQP